jgi:hypothetical protein
MDSQIMNHKSAPRAVQNRRAATQLALSSSQGLRKHLQQTGIAAALLTTMLLVNGSARAGVTVDGNLSDWGVVSVADNNGSNYGVSNNSTGTTGLPGGGTAYYHTEDQNDNAGDGGFLDPNYGGQNYDAEYMGATIQGTKMSIAIVTGQRSDNGLNRFAPGDIQIVTSIGTFGIEAGGGPGTGGAAGAIVSGDLGSTYRLNSNGFTTGVLESDGTVTGNISGSPALVASAQQTAGSMWLDPQWLLDPISPQGNTQFQFVGGTLIGEVDYFYTNDTVTDEHAIIELSFDAAAMFGAGVTIESVHWRPSCGNDELNLTLGETVVPEPSSMIIWSMLALGAVFYRRRRR